MSENNEWLKITYKILGDILFISLAFFALALIAETLIPGIIATYITLTKISLEILLIFGIIVILENKIEAQKQKSNFNLKKPLPIFFISLLIILSIISLRKFEIAEIVVIITTTLVILFYLHKENN